jgi:D-lactate dehydrogenase (cytochrome)
MLPSRIPSRRPRGVGGAVLVNRDADVAAAFLEDAAHFPGGHTAGVVHPATEAEIAALLQTADAVLPVGAQSSLTGGATPQGEIVLTTSKLDRILEIGDDVVRVQAGVSMAALDEALARAGRYYPPAPTFTGATVGGTIATNAAGAATFKYGATRAWVRALTVVLPSGDVIDLERGSHQAVDGRFDLVLSSGVARVPLPRYRMPDVPKVSAGYFAAPDMQPIDLWIGAEGTLGIVTEATLRVSRTRPAVCLAFVPFADRRLALAFVRRLRAIAKETWAARAPGGVDVSAIEHMDARCLALLREDGADRENGVGWPDGTAIALLITLELPSETTPDRAFDEIGRSRDAAPPDTPLVRFCRLLDEAGVLDEVEIAVPGDRARAAQLIALREAVPAAVNDRVGRAKRLVHPLIEKTAADMIVPFDRLEELMDLYDEEFRRRGLDAAVWGHVSDGNLHPNVIPRTLADVEAGKEAIITFGREVIRLGGSPLAEHGVGRNAIKQQLLAALYGARGVDEMRAVKRAIDPRWTLAPGVLFTR